MEVTTCSGSRAGTAVMITALSQHCGHLMTTAGLNSLLSSPQIYFEGSISSYLSLDESYAEDKSGTQPLIGQQVRKAAQGVMRLPVDDLLHANNTCVQ